MRLRPDGGDGNAPVLPFLSHEDPLRLRHRHKPGGGQMDPLPDQQAGQRTGDPIAERNHGGRTGQGTL